MSRIAIVAVLILGALTGRAQDDIRLSGRVEGGVYVAANGVYRIPIPIHAGLGGSISDTPASVTFEDAYTTHISIATVPQDPTQRWQLSTRGTKDYLVYFFTEFVLRDFKRVFGNVRVGSTGIYLPRLLDGAFVTTVLIPGGSMFANRLRVVALDREPPVAKRGNLIFVKDGHIFVVSIELAERVLEGGAYSRTPDEEDAILRKRLVETVSRIEFPRRPPP
jgi:hypothetical protein